MDYTFSSRYWETEVLGSQSYIHSESLSQNTTTTKKIRGEESVVLGQIGGKSNAE